MRLYSRTAWGARRPLRPPTALQRSAQQGLAIHHSGSAAERKDDHRHCPRVVQGIQSYHQRNKGWNDVAYSWLVCQHGGVFEGRGLGRRSAAQGTNAGNSAWHAVCYLGDGDSFHPAPEVVSGLLWVRARVLQWSPAAVRVWPHLRFTSTECPGGALREWCRQFP